MELDLTTSFGVVDIKCKWDRKPGNFPKKKRLKMLAEYLEWRDSVISQESKKAGINTLVITY